MFDKYLDRGANRPVPGYDCSLHKKIWCPITKEFGSSTTRRAAHLVPYQIGYETTGDIFGVNGYNLQWSMGNGLPMNKRFEQACENFDFCLLPRETPGSPVSGSLC
jgi:hypothetical protein